jgi:HKD family nuclease
MIQLINNNSEDNHFTIFQQLFKEADEVMIMVAFLKFSGLKKLEQLLKLPKRCEIIVGANFGLTEPKALNMILKWGKETGKITGFINRLDSKEVFHPKMYLFRKGKEAHIIVGSANLTGGGLVDNNECSLYSKCTTKDGIWKDTKQYFEECCSPEKADPLNERIISLYTGFYLKQKPANEEIDKFPDVSESLIYDLKNLKSLYNKFDHNEIRIGIKEKEEHYAEAKKILDLIASKQHSDEDFRDLLEDLVGKEGIDGLWYSNGMHRQKTRIYAQQSSFRILIKYIKNNLDNSPQSIYEGAKKIMRNIKGVGPNYVGEIMMTYAPKKLANINRNPITVLRKEGCVNLKDHSQKFNGQDYNEYNNIVKDIVEKLGLNSMLAADYFFNRIYQNLKSQSKS